MRFAFAAATFACCFATTTDVSGSGGAATDSYEGIRGGVPLDVHGLADIYFENNLDAPSSGIVAVRAFDTEANTPALGLLRLTAAHAPSPFGFRVDAAVGDLSSSYLRFDPAETGYPALSRALSYVEQAFVTATAPVGRGLSFDVGKFGTPVGMEDNEALDNWNYSRSLLYLLAEPSYHTGLRGTYEVEEKVAVSAYWVNGWDANVLAGNGMRAFAVAATWDPTERLEIVADYMGGLERAPTHLSDPALAFRHELDAYATYDLTDRLSFASTADYGHDAAVGGVSYWGVAGYLRCRMLDWLAGAVRGEHYEDPDGFTSGRRQRLAEITTTLETRDRIGPLMVVSRLEYRRDQSDAHVFESSTTRLSPRQDTLSLSLLTAF